MNLHDALLGSSEPEQTGPSLYIPTGLSMLNTALSGRPDGGLEAGSVVWLTGSPNSGRTTFALTLFSEASHINALDDYWFVYYGDSWDNYLPEDYPDRGFRHRLIRQPMGNVVEFWDYVENFDYPFIIVLDSIDVLSALSSDPISAWRLNNARANTVFDVVRRKKSLLVITCKLQLRDDHMSSQGGTSLPFYADYWFRLRHYNMLIQKILGRPRFVGSNSHLRVIKSKTGLGMGTVLYTPIYYGTGYDDIESIVDFLCICHSIKVTPRGWRFQGRFYLTKEDIVAYVRKDPVYWTAYAARIMRRRVGFIDGVDSDNGADEI